MPNNAQWPHPLTRQFPLRSEYCIALQRAVHSVTPLATVLKFLHNPAAHADGPDPVHPVRHCLSQGRQVRRRVGKVNCGQSRTQASLYLKREQLQNEKRRKKLKGILSERKENEANRWLYFFLSSSFVFFFFSFLFFL